MSKFYVGQPVRHVCGKSPLYGFTSDKTYLVNGVNPWRVPNSDIPHIQTIDDSGRVKSIHVDWFEPIFTPTSELKAGDRVMVLASRMTKQLGQIATIKGEEYLLYMSFDRHDDDLGWYGYHGDWYFGGEEYNLKVVKISGEPAVTKETITLGVKPSIADDLRLKPQARRVLSHLKSGHALTHLEAQAVYGIWSLSSRVSELKSVGYKVKRQLKNDAMGKRYASYSMAA